MPSNHLILCHPLLLLPSIFPNMRVFSNESALSIRWPKYWSFSFSISPSNEYPGLISFRMDWLDLLAVQGTLKSLLQHYSSKASILLCSAFFIVQLSCPYMTTRKTIVLTRWTFVDKLMSLLYQDNSFLIFYSNVINISSRNPLMITGLSFIACGRLVISYQSCLIDVFELWYWRRLLRVPWTVRRSTQSDLKEINPECSFEGLMLKLKLQ